jgi:hypothetical protein
MISVSMVRGLQRLCSQTRQRFERIGSGNLDLQMVNKEQAEVLRGYKLLLYTMGQEKVDPG